MAFQTKNILINRIMERHLNDLAAKYLVGRMIDIGCGIKPYRELVAPYIREHVGLDYEGSLHDRSKVDLTGLASAIPAADSSFDCALCTAVLEHLPEPEAALHECFRVLRPGGVAVYTAPFIWHLHEEPHDFYRYSKYGLRYLFEKAGFEVLELRPLSGFWVTFGQLLVYYLYGFHRGPLRWIPIIPLLGLLIQGMSYLLDRLHRAEQWTWMYLAVVRRPAQPAL